MTRAILGLYPANERRYKVNAFFLWLGVNLELALNELVWDI